MKRPLRVPAYSIQPFCNVISNANNRGIEREVELHRYMPEMEVEILPDYNFIALTVGKEKLIIKRKSLIEICNYVFDRQPFEPKAESAPQEKQS